MGDESVTLMAVVEGAITAEGGASAVGDLFLTDAGLWFFSYADAARLAGPQGAASAGVAGVIAGGVIGGVVAYEGQKKMNAENYRRLLLNVDKQRALRFGLSLEERLKTSWHAETWAHFVPRDSIARVLLDPAGRSVTCVTRDGTTHSWGVATWGRTNRDRLNDWAAQMSAAATSATTSQETSARRLPDPEAFSIGRRYGLGLSLPGPKALIEALARGECPSKSHLDAISENDGYLASLYWNLVGTPQAPRIEACQTLNKVNFKGMWRLRQIAREDLPQTMGCGIALLVFVTLPLGVFLTLLGLGAGSSGLVPLLLGVFLLGFSAAMPLWNYLMPARTILRTLGSAGAGSASGQRDSGEEAQIKRESSEESRIERRDLSEGPPISWGSGEDP